MSLFFLVLFFLNLLARACAWARVAVTFEGAAGPGPDENASLVEHLRGLQPWPALGGLQLLGACCGEQRGKALEVQSSINSNTLYGATKEIAEVLFNSSACSPVPETDRGQKAKAGCAYVAIFANTEFADNEYAANCVPAQICKEDVLGRTKGLIATYGVLLQTMQQNLGSLVYLSEGPIGKCYEGREKINLGQLRSLLQEKEIRLEDEDTRAVLGSEMVMEIPGMESLGSQESLLPCKDDPSLGYLFVHRNRYWSSEKQAVDLTAFESRQSQSRLEKEEQLRSQALKELSSEKGEGKEEGKEEPEEPEAKAELQALERIDAVAPEALGVKALDEPKRIGSEKATKAGSAPRLGEKAGRELIFKNEVLCSAPFRLCQDSTVEAQISMIPIQEALKEAAEAKPKHVEFGAAGAATLASAPSSSPASPRHPVVLGQRYHSNWNLPSISPVHCTLLMNLERLR